MRIAITYNRKNDKPGCLILRHFPKGISVFHLSNSITKSVEACGQTASLYIKSHNSRMKHGPFLDKESAGIG
jgi:hypothetical protein